MRTYPHAAVACALGLRESDLAAEVSPQTVSTGTPQLMVALRDVETLDRVQPDVRKLFHDLDRDYFSVHVFARRHGGEAALCARHFADFNGIIEDPFTGSASGGMAAYCARYGLIDRAAYTIEQGRHAGRPGVGYIRVLGDAENIEGIEVGGEAVTVMRGTLLL